MSTFYRLLGFLSPYKRGVVVSWILASFAMAMSVLLPVLTGRAVETINKGARHTRLHELGLALARPPHAAAARPRDPGRGDGALGFHLLAAHDRRTGLTRRRVRPARAPLQPAAALGARLLRPPADRSVDVARDRRPARGALLPRLRPRVHPAVRAHDRARRHRHDRDQPLARLDLACRRRHSWS